MLSEFDGRDPSRSALDLISMHDWNIAKFNIKEQKKHRKKIVFLWCGSERKTKVNL